MEHCLLTNLKLIILSHGTLPTDQPETDMYWSISLLESHCWNQFQDMWEEQQIVVNNFFKLLNERVMQKINNDEMIFNACQSFYIPHAYFKILTLS